MNNFRTILESLDTPLKWKKKPLKGTSGYFFNFTDEHGSIEFGLGIKRDKKNTEFIGEPSFQISLFADTSNYVSVILPVGVNKPKQTNTKKIRQIISTFKSIIHDFFKSKPAGVIFETNPEFPWFIKTQQAIAGDEEFTAFLGELHRGYVYIVKALSQEIERKFGYSAMPLTNTGPAFDVLFLRKDTLEYVRTIMDPKRLN